MNKIFKKRMFAKILSFQGIYSWFFLECDIEKIENFLIISKNINKVDIIFLKKILYNIPKKNKILTFILNNVINKNITTNLLEDIIIKIVLLEIFFLKESSFNVIINESANLSKKFCSKSGYTIINKILNLIFKNYINNNKFLLNC